MTSMLTLTTGMSEPKLKQIVLAGFWEDDCWGRCSNETSENVMAISKLCQDEKLLCNTENFLRIDEEDLPLIKISNQF